MSKNFMRVEVMINSPREVCVPLKNGLKIVMFCVAIATSSVESVYAFDLWKESPASGVQLHKSDANFTMEENDVPSVSKEHAMLYNSLMEHRGDRLNEEEMQAFHVVADQASKICFTDSMVCYEDASEDRHVTFLLLTPSSTIIHISQYFTLPKDRVVYSIERNQKFLRSGTFPIDDFLSPLKQVLLDVESNA